MICIQKIYGFHNPNHQIIEESSDVTPVTEDGRTDGWTDGKWKIEQCSVGPETAKWRLIMFLRPLRWKNLAADSRANVFRPFVPDIIIQIY